MALALVAPLGLRLAKAIVAGEILAAGLVLEAVLGLGSPAGCLGGFLGCFFLLAPVVVLLVEEGAEVTAAAVRAWMVSCRMDCWREMQFANRSAIGTWPSPKLGIH
jgi:hypothetical protein